MNARGFERGLTFTFELSDARYLLVARMGNSIKTFRLEWVGWIIWFFGDLGSLLSWLYILGIHATCLVQALRFVIVRRQSPFFRNEVL